MKNILKILGLILVPSFAFAQVNINDVIKNNEGEPINITSESLVIRNSENLSIFENNVKVVQGNMTLKANQMRVYSEVDEQTKKSKFKKIEASGNVDFRSGDKTALADQAVYDIKAGMLVLRDNVRLNDTESSLQGRMFEYNVRTGMSKISNSGGGGISVSNKGTAPASTGRAKVTFTPGEEAKDFKTPMDVIKDVKGTNKKKEIK